VRPPRPPEKSQIPDDGRETFLAQPNGGALTALGVYNLSRSFDGLQAVADVSFSATSGRITGLIGPNGAGKSTALAIVAGSLKPSAGSVFFMGRNVTGMPSYRLARLGIARTFQMVGDFDRLTVLENLLVAAPRQRGERIREIYSLRRSWRQQEAAMVERARGLLARFELSNSENTCAGELSGGQRRLMELARALMADPTLLLLDEPMAGVNPRLMHQLGEHLLSLARSGLAIVLVEHELRLIEQVCDHVVVLAQGRVIGTGSMAEVRQIDEVLEAYIAG
jgi:neutral amino acid transport system ATP-binding protein